MADEIIYQDQAVHITPMRAVVGDKTYLVAELTSAYMVKIAGDQKLSCLLLAVGAGACGLAGTFLSGYLAQSEANLPASETNPFSVVLLVLAGLGALLFVTGAVIAFVQKPRYAVRIKAKTGDFNMLALPTPEKAQAIVSALNAAIARRG